MAHRVWRSYWWHQTLKKFHFYKPRRFERSTRMQSKSLRNSMMIVFRKISTVGAWFTSTCVRKRVPITLASSELWRDKSFKRGNINFQKKSTNSRNSGLSNGESQMIWHNWVQKLGSWLLIHSLRSILSRGLIIRGDYSRWLSTIKQITKSLWDHLRNYSCTTLTTNKFGASSRFSRLPSKTGFSQISFMK